MTALGIYWAVRDKLMTWGLVERREFRMRRRPAGEVRDGLARRGTRRRMRRVPLPRLMRL